MFKAIIKNIFNSISAGIVIAIGGSVFLACASEQQRYLGAILFSVALLCICLKGYALFTGKVGFIIESHTRKDFTVLLTSLLGNLIGTIICGYAIRYTFPVFADYAFTLCIAKLDQQILQALIRSIFCGILMYLAVSIYRDKKSLVGILFCVPVFILSGFEHSIANMFYFATSGIVSWSAFLYIMIVVTGNAIGGMLLPVLTKTSK